MAGIMIELAEPVIVDAPPMPRRKRISGYDRMKRKNQFLQRTAGDLAGDVVALENLVRMLLNHLEAAIDPDLTEQDRSRYRRVVGGVRAQLDEAEEPPSPAEQMYFGSPPRRAGGNQP